MPDANCPSAHSGAVWESLQPLGRRPRRGVRGRFKAAAGRGRRRRPGWLARSRQSAARGPAGATLLLVRARRRWPRAGAQPRRERTVSRPAALRGGGRRALCSVQGLEVWPAVWPVLRLTRHAAIRCTGLHSGGGGLRLCVASVPTTRSGVTVCNGEVARYSDPSGEGLAAAQTDSFDCTHLGVPRLGCPGKDSAGRWATGSGRGSPGLKWRESG